ncbi:hypothetical protein Q7C36_005598 [Tachysurus vachellii]|uniref:Uncharacterized protein n=1 Tax=Tachysurus vachellii TaxID=175792 RepID=A0AA88NI37_TACVA|nr:hypothetical protein Q7C36_005598 [Tachysurus vachellii]
MASEIFEATSSRSIESSSSGSIMDHGNSLTSQSDGMYAPQHASPGHPASHHLLFSHTHWNPRFLKMKKLAASSAQEPIVILNEQEEHVSQNLFPQSLHDLKGPVDDIQTLLMRAIHESNIFEGHEKSQQLCLNTQGK